MKFLIWNIRGLNKPFKQKEIVKMTRRLKLSILCLVETHVKQENALRIKQFMLPRWDWVSNYCSHWSGRIWICWDPSVFSLHLLSIHEQVITCKIDDLNGKGPWCFSVAYGANAGVDRRRMFQELIFAKSLVGSFPWLIAGDFNVIRSQNEKWGYSSLSCYEQEFVDCLNLLEVEDLSFTGAFHIWSNKQSTFWREVSRITLQLWLQWTSSIVLVPSRSSSSIFGQSIKNFWSGLVLVGVLKWLVIPCFNSMKN